MMSLLLAGDPLRKKLDKIRADIETTVAAIETARSAPISTDELRETIRQFVADHSGGGVVSSLRLLRHPRAHVSLHDWEPLAVITALFGQDEIERRIFATIMPEGTPDGLSATDRAQQIAAFEKRLHELELAEEVEICRLETGGACVLRRREVRPEILLAAWADLDGTA